MKANDVLVWFLLLVLAGGWYYGYSKILKLEGELKTVQAAARAQSVEIEKLRDDVYDLTEASRALQQDLMGTTRRHDGRLYELEFRQHKMAQVLGIILETYP